uniref:Uncharacterized protein n=1 Tax=Octopus bimaculoides TaxID=37653 RepID=A0A0L8HWQ2_OCTBM
MLHRLHCSALTCFSKKQNKRNSAQKTNKKRDIVLHRFLATAFHCRKTNLTPNYC